MSYKKANNLLPADLVELIQQYVEGEYIYIPRKEDNKKSWGSNTTTRRDLDIEILLFIMIIYREWIWILWVENIICRQRAFKELS